MAGIKTTHYCPFANDEDFACSSCCALALVNEINDKWTCSIAIMGQRACDSTLEEGPLYEAQEVEEV